jgi:hypothetical protein
MQKGEKSVIVEFAFRKAVSDLLGLVSFLYL